MTNVINVDYSTKIPNNVGLTEDRTCCARSRAGILATSTGGRPWGRKASRRRSFICAPPSRSIPRAGPNSIMCRCPNIAGASCWRRPEEDRKIPFGRHYGEPVWQEVPGEYRAMLRRLVVIQGDTEPASVEQQRHLGKTAPSLYDLRNVFQVNVEEGRHLWAMVYILQKYFGRDGREEAAELLQRRSGSADKPRMLGAFNEATPDWLSFLHVHVLHRPRRQDAAREPGAIGFRSALTHLPLHADRRGAPHVRRRDRHRPHPAAHLRGNEGGRHRGPERHRQGACARRDRSADHAEEAQPALYAVARPVRLRSLDQRRQRLQRRPQGPLPGDQDRRRPPARELDLSGAQAGRRRDQTRRRAGAHRDQHAAARRLHRRLPARPRPLEQDHRAHRRQLQIRAAARRLPPPYRRVQRHAGDTDRRADRRRDLEQRQGQMAALERGRRFHRRA